MFKPREDLKEGWEVTSCLLIINANQCLALSFNEEPKAAVKDLP